MCLQRRKEKSGKKRVEGRKKKRGYFPLFFFLFFSVGNTARDTQTPRVHARNYSPRCYGHILCIPAYTHTRDVLKPLYTGQPVWRTNCSAYTCHRRQGSQLRQWWWAREDGFSFVLKRRRQTSWIKTAARREFRYEKLWGRKKYRGNLF